MHSPAVHAAQPSAITLQASFTRPTFVGEREARHANTVARAAIGIGAMSLTTVGSPHQCPHVHATYAATIVPSSATNHTPRSRDPRTARAVHPDQRDE